MPSGGFERQGHNKETLSAKQYGIECKCMEECKAKNGIRIPIKTDRRIFTPIDRSSYKWERCYKERTAVERVNSRLDESFRFEKHSHQRENNWK